MSGVYVGDAYMAPLSASGGDESVFGTVNFAGIAPVAGGYQVDLVLQNTVPLYEGSVAWLDGGATGLSGTTTPEPGSMLLMATFLMALGPIVRKKLW